MHVPPRSPRDVHRSSQGGANDARLRNGESQSSSIASGAQSAPSGRDAFGKTPSRRHSQFSDGNADRVCVALPAVDRYLPHRVEHSVEQSVLLERTARQRADLPSFADGRSDDERIPMRCRDQPSAPWGRRAAAPVATRSAPVPSPSAFCSWQPWPCGRWGTSISSPGWGLCSRPGTARDGPLDA